jgi:hypothetical protein
MAAFTHRSCSNTAPRKKPVPIVTAFWFKKFGGVKGNKLAEI